MTNRLYDPRENKSPPSKERLPWIVSMMWDAGLYTQAREVQRLGDAYYANDAQSLQMHPDDAQSLQMHPDVVKIVEHLSTLPPSKWLAKDAKVLLGFCVLHAAAATAKLQDEFRRRLDESAADLKEKLRPYEDGEKAGRGSG